MARQTSNQRIVDLHSFLAAISDAPTQEAIRHVADALVILAQQQRTITTPPTPLSPDTKAGSLTVQQISNQLAAGGIAPIVLTGLPGASSSVAFGTHALRPSPTSSAVGALYYETDRTVLYITETFSGAAAWAYVAGIYSATYASRPTDLALHDAGFQFYATDQNELNIWSGTAWVLDELTDAVTNAVTTIRRIVHLTSGVAANGFGARFLTQLANDAAASVDGSGLDTIWTTAAAGTETSDLAILLRNVGAVLTEVVRITGAGDLGIGIATPASRLHVKTAASGLVSTTAGINVESNTDQYINLFAPINTQQGILFGGGAATGEGSVTWEDGTLGNYLTLGSQGSARIYVVGAKTGVGTNAPDSTFHINGDLAIQGAGGANRFRITGTPTAAPRTITLPDVDDTVVTLNASQTLTLKTLTTPTIGSFTNAQHDHSNAANGGTLNAVSGSFTTVDGKTVTVTNGIITGIV